MYIIELIPLAKLPPQAPQILSYFFDRELAVGTQVECLIGKRKTEGIVISARQLEKEKMSVKKAGYQMRRLSSVLSDIPSVSPTQLAISGWLATRYYAPISLCLKAVLPAFFGIRKYKTFAGDWYRLKPPSVPAPVFIQTGAKDTLKHLCAQLKTASEEGGQSLILVPEVVIAGFFYEALKDDKIALLTSETKNSEAYKIWQSVAAGKTKIVVATRLGLFLPFQNLKLIAVEDPSNEAYKSDMTPKFSAPDVASMLASRTGARLVFLASSFGTDAINLFQHKLAVLTDRYPSNLPEIVVSDAVSEMKSGNFSMFSRRLQELLESAVRRRKNILFYSARKAYSGIYFCRNCGATARCPNCEIPYRFYKAPAGGSGSTEKLLICYHCAGYKVAPAVCPNCSSNRLTTGGFAGSQKIKESFMNFLDKFSDSEMEAVKKSVEIFILDSDMVKTGKDESELMGKISRSTYPVVIATQMILSHRYSKKFELVAVPNADALTSARDFRTEERFAFQFRKLLDFNPEAVVLQTYSPDSRIFTAARTGNWEEFAERELEVRKALNYPPASRLVKLTFRHHDRKKAELTARSISEKLRMAIHHQGLENQVSALGPSPSSVAKEKNIYNFNIILKISPALEKIEAVLKYVPTDWLIDPDPKNLV